MPRFIMLCGPSASGKSSFRSRLLQEAKDTVVISSDDILMDWAEADGLSYQDAFVAYRDKTDALMEDIASAAFSMGRDIIWDQTHLTRDIRRHKLTEVPDQYDKVAVAFEAPLEMLLERASSREADTGKEVPVAVIRTQAEAYQRPDFDEGFDSIVLVSEPGHKVQTL
jgi:predicted kinase